MMERLPGWERRLTEAVQRHECATGAYGLFDCFTLPADAVEAVTGVRIFRDCRRYRTPKGAARALRRKGFYHVGEAFASLFSETPALLARRGDIGVTENENGEICGGVFTAAGFKTRGAERLIIVPRASVIKAFKVG